MEEIYKRYNSRIEKIYNLFLSEQKGGTANIDILNEDIATTDNIKSASNFEVEPNIKSNTKTSLQPIESIFKNNEKEEFSKSDEPDKSAESDKLPSIINNQSAETETPKFSDYEPKIIELEKEKELDKLDNSKPDNLKNIINDGDKKTKIEVDYKFEDFKKLFGQDKTKDVPKEYFNLSSKCLGNILDDKYDNFGLEKEFAIEESKNHCFVCGEQISNIFFDKDEVSQLLNINTKEHKNLEYLNFIRCHKDCKIHTNLGIDKLDFISGKLSVKDLGEINQIIDDQIGGGEYKLFDDNDMVQVKNGDIIQDLEYGNKKYTVYFKTLRPSMDFFWNTNNQVAALRNWCIGENYASDTTIKGLLEINREILSEKLDGINKLHIKRFIAEFYFTNNPIPCYLKDFKLNPKVEQMCACVDLDTKENKNIIKLLFENTKLGENLQEKFNLKNYYSDENYNYNNWLKRRVNDLRMTLGFYHKLRGDKSYQTTVDLGQGVFEKEHVRPHLIALAEGKLNLPILYQDLNRYGNRFVDQYTNYIKSLEEGEVISMIANFFKCCPACNKSKNVIDNEIKRNFIESNQLGINFRRNMFPALNENYDGVIFSDKDDKYFCLIKKPLRGQRHELSNRQLIKMLEIAKGGANFPNLEYQFAFLLKEINKEG